MKQLSSIDTDDLVYNMLRQAKADGVISISGVICPQDDRPADSQREDIVFNTIAVTQDKPQDATVNINVYVPNKLVKLGGRDQYAVDRPRLQQLGDALVSYLLRLNYPEFEMWIESDLVLNEPSANQHYRNLRLKLNIH
jgi:hypothetical protein